MTSRVHPNVLLLEGKEDLLVVAELLEASGVPWVVGNEPVLIEPAGSVDELFRPGFIQATLKRSQLKACGIMVDGDVDPAARWRRIRSILRPSYPTIPEDLPSPGLIHAEGTALPKVGIWVMPDNISQGMLETLLLASRRSNADLDKHAGASVDAARAFGAPWRDVHRHKAELHTWLAWQDPPGSQMHQAVAKKWLVPQGASIQRFIEWARQLFELGN